MSDETYIHPTAVILGNAIIGKHSSIWPNAVIRADFNTITVGDYTSIQDCSVIHCTPFNPTTVGDYVTLGHGGVLHACTIDDYVLVGMNATVLDGAHVESNCVIAAGSVVLPNTRVPEGSLVTGVPGKIHEGKANRDAIRNGALTYYELSRRYLQGREGISLDEIMEAMKKHMEEG
jgi:carbonic anhydrase/acetyltransferase-like protein (isoleucine patch superfamily)